MATLNETDLIESAREWAERSLVNYQDNRRRQFYVDAAIALEHLCKAFLVSFNPALIADLSRKDFDSLLHLCGLEKHSKKDHPKTISGTEALERVRKILPGMTAPQQPLRNLVDVRDGVIHAGFLPPATARESLVAFLAASNEIFEALGISEDARWGTKKSFVDGLISLNQSGVEEAVRNLIENARKIFQDLVESVPESSLSAIISTRYESAPELADEEEAESTTPCPACSKNAKCAGPFDVDWEVDGDWDDDGPSHYAYPVVTIYPDRLSCPICSLRLSSRDQLAAAEVPGRWEVPTSAVTNDALDAAIERASAHDEDVPPGYM